MRVRDATSGTDGASHEESIAALARANRYGEAATLLLRTYGPEVYGFLLATHRDEATADDVFSATSERAWRGLPGFRWECSARTWLYTIARNEARTNARRKRALGDPASPSEAERVAAQVRSETTSMFRTEKRARLLALRDELTEEELALLVLRVDRDFDWNQVARAMSGEVDAPVDPQRLLREAARLRKRYQLLRDRLRRAAQERGLI
jgi:RNA polymerase sigma-70 factor (ECF subfamily)